MRVIAGAAERGPVVSSAVLLSALAVLTLTTLTAYPLREVAFGVAAVVVATVAYRQLLAWRSLLALLIVVILFVPIRRYALPGDLPFELEPYRIFVAFLLAGWVASLLVDPRVRLRRSGFEGPIALFVIAVLGSELANPGRVAAASTDVAKSLTFFVSFLLVFYLVVSVVRSFAAVDLLIHVLVVGGTLVAALAVIESRTGYNVFNHLSGVVPYLELQELPREQGRGERLRTVASAQHAIALSAVLVMLVPLAIYLTRRTARRGWWLAVAVLTLGALSTVSRTGVLMLVAVGLVFLWLRAAETKRLWPALILILLAVHMVLPATLGPLKNSFFPPGGLIEEQRSEAGLRGSGRIADLGPALDEAGRQPLLGQGFGTRIVEWGRANAAILDNQWLGTLLETGILGFTGLLWLFLRAIRRMARVAKEDPSPRGWLFVGLTAAITAYAVGMLTYDAFAFIQVTFVLFLLLAFGAALLSAPERRAAAV